jgi:hypothetical protein
MPEIQQPEEVSMDEYVQSRTSTETEKPAATTPQEQVTTSPESATGTPESEKEKQVSGGWQRRIDKLTKRNTETEAALRDEREARQRLEAKLSGRAPTEQVTGKPVESGTRPKPNAKDLKADGTAKYADWEEYIDDLTDWKSEQKEAKILDKVRQESKQTQEQQEAEKQGKAVMEIFVKRADASVAKHPDWKEVVYDEDSPITQIQAGSVMDGFILDSEQGTELLYHLAKNPDDFTRIAALGPFAQARELHKIEMSLGDSSAEEKSSPEPKKNSLPAPIKPLSVNTSKSTVSLDKMSMEDYARARKAQQGR